MHPISVIHTLETYPDTVFFTALDVYVRARGSRAFQDVADERLLAWILDDRHRAALMRLASRSGEGAA